MLSGLFEQTTWHDTVFNIYLTAVANTCRTCRSRNAEPCMGNCVSPNPRSSELELATYAFWSFVPSQNFELRYEISDVYNRFKVTLAAPVAKFVRKFETMLLI